MAQLSAPCPKNISRRTHEHVCTHITNKNQSNAHTHNTEGRTTSHQPPRQPPRPHNASGNHATTPTHTPTRSGPKATATTQRTCCIPRPQPWSACRYQRRQSSRHKLLPGMRHQGALWRQILRCMRSARPPKLAWAPSGVTHWNRGSPPRAHR